MRQRTGRLEGRRIIVTGAAAGIGRAIARLFAHEDAALVLVDRDASALAATAAELGARAVLFDLAQTEVVGDLVERAAQDLGGLDGVVNCAGVSVSAPIREIDGSVLAALMAVNLIAPYRLCQAALPHLLKAEGSTVVNVASGMGLHPSVPNGTAYAATKGGLIAFTKAFAAEVGPRVRANALCPGVTLTAAARPVLEGYEGDPALAPFVQQYALKRVAEPDEIAAGALFLTSRESSFVTGVALAVDGGRTYH